MKLKDKVIARMVELAGSPDSEWTAVPGTVGAIVRYTWTIPTPDYARSEKRYGGPMWSGETYDAHVFLTLVAGKFILGVAPAPWVGRRDSGVSLWLAEAILEDPELASDGPRQWRMKAGRKAAARKVSS